MSASARKPKIAAKPKAAAKKAAPKANAKPATKKSPGKKVGAKSTAKAITADEATEQFLTPAAKPAAKAAPATKAAVKTEVQQVPATPEQQEIANKVFTIDGELRIAKAQVNTVDGKLKDAKQELIEAGAVAGTLFTNEEGDPVQMTHNTRNNVAYAKAIKMISEAHPELADEITSVIAECTTESQQAPGFKAA